MARRKDTPKPLFAVKHDFVDSLDRFIQEVVSLRLALDQALQLNLVQAPAKDILEERLKALGTAMDSDPD